MTRHEKIIARNSRNKKIKWARLALGLLAGLLALAVLGTVGHYDYQTALWEKTIDACEHKQRDCMPLINKVQQNPRAEVLEDGYGVWIEYK